MPAGREWRLRTAFRDVVIRVTAPTRRAQSPLLNELLFELHGRNPEVSRVLLEVQHALKGVGPLRRADALSQARLNLAERDLVEAARRGQLELEEVIPTRPARRRLSAAPVASSLGPQDEAVDFIELVLVDQDDQPVARRPFNVELPSGAVRSGQTDDAGRARVDGIPPGQCKITFPDFEKRDYAFKEALPGKRPDVASGPARIPDPELDDDGNPIARNDDDSPPGPSPAALATLSFDIKDKSGVPLRSEPFLITFADGSSQEGTLDDDGFASLADVPPGTAELSFPQLRGSSINRKTANA